MSTRTRPRRARKWREAPELEAFLKRMARALTRRAAEGDLEALSALHGAAQAVDDAMGQAARELHGFGYSWTEIGREVGLTRQGARQRWAELEEGTG